MMASITRRTSSPVASTSCHLIHLAVVAMAACCMLTSAEEFVASARVLVDAGTIEAGVWGSPLETSTTGSVASGGRSNPHTASSSAGAAGDGEGANLEATEARGDSEGGSAPGTTTRSAASESHWEEGGERGTATAAGPFTRNSGAGVAASKDTRIINLAATAKSLTATGAARRAGACTGSHSAVRARSALGLLTSSTTTAERSSDRRSAQAASRGGSSSTDWGVNEPFMGGDQAAGDTEEGTSVGSTVARGTGTLHPSGNDVDEAMGAANGGYGDAGEATTGSKRSRTPAVAMASPALSGGSSFARDDDFSTMMAENGRPSAEPVTTTTPSNPSRSTVGGKGALPGPPPGDDIVPQRAPTLSTAQQTGKDGDAPTGGLVTEKAPQGELDGHVSEIVRGTTSPPQAGNHQRVVVAMPKPRDELSARPPQVGSPVPESEPNNLATDTLAHQRRSMPVPPPSVSAIIPPALHVSGSLPSVSTAAPPSSPGPTPPRLNVTRSGRNVTLFRNSTAPSISAPAPAPPPPSSPSVYPFISAASRSSPESRAPDGGGDSDAAFSAAMAKTDTSGGFSLSFSGSICRSIVLLSSVLIARIGLVVAGGLSA
ncbi:hypothetical protein CBR_g51110 [Chara braunii]|uniref:Uncharacterized protein n=1 Tax=Chara braunii TaxID=69332 RepID=A0A388K639_CHABU|nr:hypothetical protein CBR_g51110 [Chara braunii]|eukprot:GBG65515.1 hypothetical protein CBR_g51110 [Chara braunii]